MTSSSSTWNSSGTVFYYTGYEKRRSPRVGPNKPLKKLVEAEKSLKEERENPVGMSKDLLMFNPEDLVLGGETGWKKWSPNEQ